MKPAPLLRALFLALCAVILLPGGQQAWAASDKAAASKASPLTQKTQGWKARLDRIEKGLGTLDAKEPGASPEKSKDAPLKSDVKDSWLSRWSTELEKISLAIDKFIIVNTPLAKDAKDLLDKLGKAPKEGEPPEAETVAAQRKDLTQRHRTIDGALRSAKALRERAEQIREQVHDKRRELFRSETFARQRSPFTFSLWREAVPQMAKALSVFAGRMDFWAGRNSISALIGLLVAAALLAAGLFYVMRWLIRRYRVSLEGAPPPFFRRAASAGLVSLARMIPLVAAIGLVYGGLYFLDMLSYPLDTLAPVALMAFVAVTAISATSITLLAPKSGIWRIFPISTPAARRLSRLSVAIAVVYGLDLFLNALNKSLLAELPVTIIQSALTSVIFAGLLIGVLRTSFRPHRLGGGKKGKKFGQLLKLPLWGIVIAVLLATALGYISLARFLTHQTVVTGSILVIAYLAWLAIGEFTDSFGNEERPAGQYLATQFSFEQQRREQMGALAMLGLSVMLALMTLPLLALQWGFGWSDVSLWGRKLLFGFEFGGLRISLSAVLIALSLFGGGVVLTRLFQGWLDRKILSKSRSQTGAEDSIKTAVGYLGIVLSALLAISYTGIGFSNIAIVAGALSVGIGFGLQSIVNNFVSGLILLAERPIKVGDWIVVGGDEGNVKRISVRSTEIETFDRAHIIIPNSELISGTVKNWTLRSHLGRIIISVGVSYDADPQRVHDLLIEIANDNPSVLTYPAAFCVFEDFGDSSLNFTLRCYVADITNSLGVRTALRMAIFNRFKDEGIEIPFPQHDLNLRDMERLENALAPRPPKHRRKRKPRNVQRQSPQDKDAKSS